MNWKPDGDLLVKRIINTKLYNISAYCYDGMFKIYYNHKDNETVNNGYNLFTLDYTLPLLNTEKSYGFEMKYDEIVRLDYYSPNFDMFIYNGTAYKRDSYIKNLFNYFNHEYFSRACSITFTNAKCTNTKTVDVLRETVLKEIKNDLLVHYHKIIDEYIKINTKKKGKYYLKWHCDNSTKHIFPQIEDEADYDDKFVRYLINDGVK